MYNAPRPLETLTHKYFCYHVFLTNIQQIVLCFGLHFFFKYVCDCVSGLKTFFLIYIFGLFFLW